MNSPSSIAFLIVYKGFAGNLLWDKGTLIYRKEFEVPLYHLVRFKRKYSEQVDLQRQIPDRFRIGKKKYTIENKQKKQSNNKQYGEIECYVNGSYGNNQQVC